MENNIKIINQKILHDRRILVTGDIHGHLRHFIQVLKEAEFCDDVLLI